MKNNYRLLLSLLLSLIFYSELHAQVYEAEDATLAGGASIVTCAGCSGENAVEQRDGNLSFEVTIAQEGYYNITINAASPGGDKINKLEIGGNTLDFSLTTNSQYRNLKLVSAQKLAAGQHQVKMLKSWVGSTSITSSLKK